MRRFRNPRYAPELLERKLHPSGFVPAVAAEVAPLTSSGSTTTTSPEDFAVPTASVSVASTEATDPPADPPVDPTDPPPPPPPPPSDPLDPWGLPRNPIDPTFADAASTPI